MKAYLQTAVLVIISFTLSGQSLEISTTSSGGSILSSTSLSVQYSIGQSFVNHWVEPDYDIQEGIFNGQIDGLISAVKEYDIEVLKLEVYPNPSDDFIVLNEKFHNEKGHVRIINQDGNVVMRKEYMSGELLPIADLFPGSYYVEMITDNSRKVSQLIKL